MLTTSFALPRFLEREKAVTVTLALYDGGTALVPPSSGTYTLKDSSGATVMTGAITVPSSGSNANKATRAILSTELPSTLQLSDQWQEEWVLTMSDGSVETIRRDVYLCLRTLYPVVSEQMLMRRVADLQNMRASGSTDFSAYIEEAWEAVEAKLLNAGKRPFLITNAWALRSYHLALSLAYLFEDASTYMSGSGQYAERAKAFREEAAAAWDELQLEYDTTQTGLRGDTATAAGAPVIYTNRPPVWSTTGWQ